jgi:hypothetical protein
MNPKILRNGMVILFLLTTINTYQSWATLHRDDATRVEQAHVETELKQLTAVVNQMCLTTHAACIYTLTTQSETAAISEAYP